MVAGMVAGYHDFRATYRGFESLLARFEIAFEF